MQSKETISDAPLSRAKRQQLQLRQDIIETSFAEFSERGYHQTSIADIAKRLGIGHGTFYRYFKNKRDILEHIFEGMLEKITTVLGGDNAPHATENLEDYREQTKRIGLALTSILIEQPGVLRMLILVSTSIDKEMTARVSQFFDWGAAQVSAYMEHGVKLGFFREDLDVEATGQVIIGMIITTAFTMHNSSDNEEMQMRIHQAVLRILVDGIAKH